MEAVGLSGLTNYLVNASLDELGYDKNFLKLINSRKLEGDKF